MIRFEEAQDIIKQQKLPLAEKEKVSLIHSLGRILAEDIVSDINMPPFDKSAMDGYACKRKDLSSELDVIEVIPAGTSPAKKVGELQCSKIMTGAQVPVGADCVIMVEQTKETAANKIRFTGENTKSNFVPEGDDVKEGDTVLKAGIIIQPQHIAVLASTGYSQVKTYKKVRVGILSTGDELVEPDTKPGLSMIRNSNAYQLMAQVERIYAEPNYFGIARDNKDDSRKKIKEAISQSDVVLLSGGVSMGDFDYIPEILKELEIELLFKSIAVQPGRPTVFGTNGQQFIFGLPGNPVSSFNIFELLVRPFLYKLMGHDYKEMIFKLPMGKEYSRNKSKRLSFLPVEIKDAKAYPVEYHGSAHINALSYAQGLVAVPIGIMQLKEGDTVDVRQI